MPKSLRVLNVEDSSRDAMLLQRHLSESGYDLEFERVETALAMKAAIETKVWDIVLADYALPRFSALEALKLVKQSGKDIPFIVISGTIGEELAVEAMRAGASDYLMKGSLTRLAAAIDRELDELKSREAGRHADQEAKRLFTEIQQQRDRLNTIVASVPGIVWETWEKPEASKQHVDYVSASVERLLGYTVKQWMAVPNFWLSIVHPNDRQEATRTAAALFAEKKGGGSQTFRWIAKDGSIVWVESNCVVVLDEAGEAVGMRGVTMDISERYRAEATMRESEDRFRSYFELGLIGMAITSLETRILEVNQEFCQTLGYQRSELLGKTWMELTHPDDVAADIVNDYRVLAAECNGYTLEKRFIHKDGHSIYSRISVKCILRADGVPASFVALLQDISESRHAEQELRDSEERYRQLFESNPDPTFVFDQETMRFLAVNAAAVSEYGYSREELLSLTALNIWQAQDIPAFIERMDQLPYGPPRGSVWRHQKKDGTIIEVEITRRPLLIEGRPASVMIAHNITKRRSLEEQFRQSQKMEAVGQLAGGMAHDFNNLLTVINGYGEFVLEKLDAHDPLRSDLEQIVRAGERAAALTRQLLAFSRKQVLLPTILNPNTVISNLEKMLRRLIGEDILLVPSLASNVGHIKADRGQIEQTLMNLVVNARDAMPSGGRITIETENVDCGEGYPADYSDGHSGPHVMFSVTDTGIGMDERIMEQIFEPFFTTKETGKGTGLGLSTVYGIVHQSGGSITVQSEVGKGTTFRIYFPRVGMEPRPHEPGATLKSALLGSETVLLTEDDDMVRALASKVLSAQGYIVLSAENGGAALLIGDRRPDNIDLLITDVVMPQLNGPELAKRLKESRPDLKVLFMSGYMDKSIALHQVADENIPFIQKPFTPMALVRKVREVLDMPDTP